MINNYIMSKYRIIHRWPVWLRRGAIAAVVLPLFMGESNFPILITSTILAIIGVVILSTD
jgi:hypothetical protein